MQRNSLLTLRLHRLNFYVVLRKLIPKLQAFPKSIQKTPMMRFYSSIHLDPRYKRQLPTTESAACDLVQYGPVTTNIAIKSVRTIEIIGILLRLR